MIDLQRNKYLETAVRTASPAQLLIMLVDGAIRFTKMGIQALEQEQKDKAKEYFGRSKLIVEEFVITLKRESPLADELLQLYEYFTFLLSEAEEKYDMASAETAVTFLGDLKMTWMEASRAMQAPKQGGAYG